MNTFQQAYTGTGPFQNTSSAIQNGQNSIFDMGSQFIATFAQGLDGAKQYPLGPGKLAFIIDSTPDSNIFYLKDTSGRGKPFRRFSYTELEDLNETEELNALKKEVAELKTLVAQLAKPLQELIGDSEKEKNNG